MNGIESGKVITVSEDTMNCLFVSITEMKVAVHFNHELTHSLALRGKSEVK